VRELYEDVWRELPDDLPAFAFALRRDFLLGNVRPGERVLDLGCGEGDFCAELASAGIDPIGAEVAEAALERARERHPGLRFELVEAHGPLPFDAAAFDVVWASEVIEHVADTGRWLSEVRRVLRPGGALLLTTPYHGRLKNLLLAVTGFEAHFDPTGQHLRFYTRRSICRTLEAFGFERIETTSAGGTPLLRETLIARARRGRP
jgi:SAM-dependent methyltransferase